MPENCPSIKVAPRTFPTNSAWDESSVSILQLRLSPELRGSALFHSGPRAQVLCQAIVTKLFCFWKTDLLKNGISAVLIYISHVNSCYTFKNHLYFSVDLWFNIITFAHFSTDFPSLFYCFVERSFLHFKECCLLSVIRVWRSFLYIKDISHLW